jgi:cupin fold WbuC family metalloprotein
VFEGDDMTKSLILGKALLAPLRRAASDSPRRRKNFNLHASLDAPCQRFFNAMEPDSYVRPHRHDETGKEETLIVVRGRIGVLEFDDAGRIVQATLLAAEGESFGAHIPLGVWHSIVSLAPGSVFLEIKGGPYAASTPVDFAPWAPQEGMAEAAVYLNQLRSALLAA